MENKEFSEMYGRFLDVSSIKKKKIDIQYGPYERNRLDVYYPDVTAPSNPTIVFFHGGAFFKGDKGRYQLKPVLYGLQKKYVVVSVNYRLIQTDCFPAAVMDAKAAIRYLKANAKELKINPDRIAVWGESAGAVLATLVGCTEHVAELEDLSMGYEHENTKVQAVIDWYAPVDLIPIEMELRKNKQEALLFNDKQTVNEATFNCEGEELLEAMKRSNAANYLHPGIPPIFIEHGTKDSIVPYQNSVDFYEKLKEYLSVEENELRLKLVEGAEHGVDGFQNEENLEEIFSFLEKWV